MKLIGITALVLLLHIDVGASLGLLSKSSAAGRPASHAELLKEDDCELVQVNHSQWKQRVAWLYRNMLLWCMSVLGQCHCCCVWTSCQCQSWRCWRAVSLVVLGPDDGNPANPVPLLYVILCILPAPAPFLSVTCWVLRTVPVMAKQRKDISARKAVRKILMVYHSATRAVRCAAFTRSWPLASVLLSI